MKKKSTEQEVIWSQNSKNRKCDDKQCNKIGEYLAPKSPGSYDKYIFCYEHVKVYNKRWNFLAGKSQAEIYEFQKNDFFENRPTKPFAKGDSSKIKFEFENYFDKSELRFKKSKDKIKNKNEYNFSNEIKSSLKTLEINDEISELKIKKSYKELVKKYHPDLNGKSKNKEKKIREINKAYKILTKFINEKYATK